MDFKVEKKVQGDVFTLTFLKTAKDVNGKDVVVVDRAEETTLKQLEERKEGLLQQVAQLQKIFKDLDSQMTAMKAL